MAIIDKIYIISTKSRFLFCQTQFQKAHPPNPNCLSRFIIYLSSQCNAISGVAEVSLALVGGTRCKKLSHVRKSYILVSPTSSSKVVGISYPCQKYGLLLPLWREGSILPKLFIWQLLIIVFFLEYISDHLENIFDNTLIIGWDFTIFASSLWEFLIFLGAKAPLGLVRVGN